jgi:hypothetical protein
VETEVVMEENAREPILQVQNLQSIQLVTAKDLIMIAVAVRGIREIADLEMTEGTITFHICS